MRKLIKLILDRLYWRHQDRMLLRDPDLRESIRQMHAGEVDLAWTLREEEGDTADEQTADEE